MRAESIVSVETPTGSEPNLNADFRLGAFTFTLLYDHVERKGIQISIKVFTIEFKKFDKNNERNPFDYKMVALNKDFGIYSVSQDMENPVALLERIEQEQA